jgi:hypothetical protein
MQNVEFWVVRGSDKAYCDSLLEAAKTYSFSVEAIKIGDWSGKLEEFKTNSTIQDALALDTPIFNLVRFTFPMGMMVIIERDPNPANSLFDKVGIHFGQETSPATFSLFIARIRKALSGRSPVVASELFTPTVQKHYEAREAALARLEAMIASLTKDVEEQRRKRDLEFEERTTTLNAQYDKRQQELDGLQKEKEDALEQRRKELEEWKAKLDTKESKFKRREHHSEIRTKIDGLLQNGYKLSTPTHQKRLPVTIFIIALLVIFVALLVQTVYEFATFVPAQSGDFTKEIFLIARSVLVSIAFLTTAIFFAKWMSQYYQRLANEEIRLQRLRLDMDRANWFVELAFQWQDENKSPIPDELLESLTRNLFVTGSDEKTPEHPADILGAAFTKLSVSPQGATLEIDKRKKRRMFQRKPKESSSG